MGGFVAILEVRLLKRALPLQEGDPFNRALFQASADTVVSRLKNLGYPYADILRNYDVDVAALRAVATLEALDRKSTRLNSSHGYISYAVFCLKKKKSLRVN